MNIREIIEHAKAGTLEVGEDVQVDPHRPNIRVGARVAYCSVPWQPSPRITWEQWLAGAQQGIIINLYYLPVSGYTPGEWSTTATVIWDGEERYSYIKTDALVPV